MHMDKILLLVVGGEPTLHAVLQDAARRAYSGTTVVMVEGVPESLNPPAAAQAIILVLVEQDASKERKLLARSNLVLSQLPVVRLGRANRTDGIEIVPPEEWNAPLLARVFRSVVREHALSHENTQLRGDLLTIGRRISHDLRSPLGGILNSAEVLQEVLAEAKSPHAELVPTIADSAHDLVKLIERVGFLLRTSASRTEKAQLPMSEPVFAALAQLENRIHAKRALVSQPSQWPEVAGIPSCLEVVWWNLVANAVQHGGAAPRIDLGWDRSGNEYRFWVWDSGQGLPPEQCRRLFPLFHRLHEPSSPRGLGLSIVQRLVELQGGRCGYEPAASGGPRFYFTLPDTEGTDNSGQCR